MLAGLGLKAEHYKDILASRPELGFFEIHAENYMGSGGPPHRHLSAIRELYEISLHGVGLSIGGPQALDREHLARLKALSQRYRPFLFSEHLAWSTHDTGYMSDLLPLPYTKATLQRVADHISEAQDIVGRPLLLENPSSYMAFEESTFSEAEFIGEVVKHTGCGLLLDVNNVFVSAKNLGTDALNYVEAYPLRHVQEIHLAGHDAVRDPAGDVLLIDAHGSEVAGDVWALYSEVIARTGPLPTLIERDNNVPSFDALLAEAQCADGIMSQFRQRAA